MVDVPGRSTRSLEQHLNKAIAIVLAPVTSRKRWYVEFAIAAAIILALHLGWDVLPNVVALGAMAIMFILVIRCMIWSWREFRRENRF